MDTAIATIINDLVSRCISFVVGKYQAHVATNKKMLLPRLQRLLLQAAIVVEETEARRVTNHGMLVQLKQLRDAMYRGYYVLDSLNPPTRGETMASHHQHKLQSDMENLEALLDGTRQFLLVLMHCPPIMVRRHQPYSAYLFMEQCMFGRHVEKERIVSFLLHRRPSCFDVLPVVGPCYVGKRTLVEHSCKEEIVQRNFTRILRFRSRDLSSNNQAVHCIVDRKLLGPNSDGTRFLILAELVDETDELAWGKLHHYLRHRAGGSKAILISGNDQVSSLGTVQALRLSTLHQEEYWYFFRVLAFGSANPYDHHPDLTSVGRDIAAELDGYFTITRTVAKLLRANMNIQFWRRALWCIRESIAMDVLVFGGDPKDQSRRFCPFFYTFTDGGDSLVVICYNRYEVIAGSAVMQGDAKMADDVLYGRCVKCGQKFDIITQSPMPPYYHYITNCVVEKPERVHRPGNDTCLKRKRNRQERSYLA